jgi:hypothetical protein
MDVDAKPAARGCLSVLSPIVWVLCVAGMAVMGAVFIEMGLEPPHENKLAGVILLPLAPTILVGTLLAAGMLWFRWDTFRQVNHTVAEMTAATTGTLIVAFGAAFLFPFKLFSALLATLTLASHVLSFVILHLQTWMSDDHQL